MESHVIGSEHPLVSLFGVTSSLAEKYLLKAGWILRDVFEHTTGRIITEATILEGSTIARFAHPRILYPNQDRHADAKGLLHHLANLEGKAPVEFAREVVTIALAPLPGFNCMQCGHCCRTLRDAFCGFVSVEEVRMWQLLGRDDIVRWIAERPRSGGLGFLAWANPKTGKPVGRCPWLRRSAGNGYWCAIHPVRPVKCAAFPLSNAQAVRHGCRGFSKQNPPSHIRRAA